MKNLDEHIAVDIEIYPNYQLVAFKRVGDGKVRQFDAYGENESMDPADIDLIRKRLMRRPTFGFNSRNYDVPLLIAIMKGKTCNELYKMSCGIIKSGKPGWMTLQDQGMGNVIEKAGKHFDIQEVAPGVMIGLKLYGGRMHSPKLQDLPFDPHEPVTPEQVADLKTYCVNDLDLTIDLFHRLEKRLDERQDMGKQYEQDLMSKSDAQIAEAVIRSELQKKDPSKYLKAPKVKAGTVIRYKPPKHIRFETEQMQDALQLLKDHKFELDANGKIKKHKDVNALVMDFGGGSKYQMGLGGLHSKDKRQSVEESKYSYLIDQDVTSYYPYLILNSGIYPKHLGSDFLNVFKRIVDKRVASKAARLHSIAATLKIVVNGAFGKLGNQYSVMFSPDLLIAVTLTGQLSLLMLIERLEGAHGIKVVSANTDGVTALVSKQDLQKYRLICSDWELETGLSLEEKKYRGLYSRDVNNYLAVYDNGNWKGKGIFSTDMLMKNPAGQICTTAVRERLLHGTSIYKTVNECTDVREFLHVRRATGGATWRGEYLGKVVRWYYSTDGDTILNAKGHKVAKSEGAKPLMELGTPIDQLDIDRERYIDEAIDILVGLGYCDLERMPNHG